MTFLQRYKIGETKVVYDEIMNLNDRAFDHEYYSDVRDVLNETFARASYNLEIIYKELLSTGYNFSKETQYNFQRPLVKPLPNTEKLLLRLDTLIKPYGFVPESLKTFYRVVGAWNFAWDYEADENILWEGSDPIQIVPLDDLLSEVIDLEGDEDPLESLSISADYLHKDNVSGGPPYSIQITKSPSVDSDLLFEDHNTSFIDYLRITFSGCGFSRAQQITDPGFIQFCERVRPQLLEI